jgi:N-acetylglucosamine kinase-like BadF-type ATPase
MNTTNLRRKERKVKKTRKKVASLIVNVQKISIREDPQAKVTMRERRASITTKRRMTIIRTRSTRITILEVFLESMKYLSTKAICSTRVNIKPNMEKTP